MITDLRELEFDQQVAEMFKMVEEGEDDINGSPLNYGMSHPTWRPNQLEALRSISKKLAGKGDHLGPALLELPTGCHAKGQPILRFDGSIVSVDSIQVGDKLMGPDGCPRQVKSIIRSSGKMVRIVPVKGIPFEVNEDHILTLVRTNTKLEYRSGRKLRKDNLLGNVLDVSVKEYLGWSHTQKHLYKLFRVGVPFFGKVLPLDPYFMGILLGDGGIKKGILVTTQDIEIVTECQKQATLFGLELRKETKPGNKTSSYQFSKGMTGGSENPITRVLRDLGLFGLGSGHKFIPPMYLTASFEQRIQLLAGLIDTDGSVSGSIDYISKSKQLAEDVTYLVRSLGMAAYLAECTKQDQSGTKGTYYRVSISGDLSKIPCRVPKKKSKIRSQIKDVLRTGFSIERLEEAPYYGFTLDKDGRYLLGDFTVTHNSGKSGIARAIGQHHRVLVLVQSHALLEQYRDKYGFEIVKGMASYSCVLPKKVEYYMAKFGKPPLVSECHMPKMSDCPVADKCPYLVARSRALAAQRMACTYPFALLSMMVQNRPGYAFWDECHISPEVLLDLSENRIGQRFLDDFNLNGFPLIGHQDILNMTNRKRLMLWAERNIMVLSRPPSNLMFESDQKWVAAKTRMTYFLKMLQDFTSEYYFQSASDLESERYKYGTEWRTRSLPGILLKPLSASKLAAKLLRGPRMTVMMSATIGNPEPLAKELGLTNFGFSSYGHPVPAPFRPVYDLECERMTYANLTASPIIYKLQAAKIARFINEWDASWRGIILTSSYEKARILNQELKERGFGDRMFTYDASGENGEVDQFMLDKRPGLLAIKPIQSWGHGIDFYGDAARWVVMAGVPFGQMLDPYQKIRMKYNNNEEYGWWQSYVHVPQAAGRVSRGETDEDGNWMLNVAALADGSATTRPAMGHYPKWFSETIVPWRR